MYDCCELDLIIEVSDLRTENTELKRLLKLAVKDLQVCQACFNCKYMSNCTKRENCKYCWRYGDIAEKLLGDDISEEST